MTDAAGQARIGCSGYDYPAWRGGFYPDDLPRDGFFDHYARTFRCVEVNNTFYNLPERGTVRQW